MIGRGVHSQATTLIVSTTLSGFAWGAIEPSAVEGDGRLAGLNVADTVAQAGTYRVQAGAPSQMALVAVKHSTAMVIDTLSITHKTDIAEPIALCVRDDEQFPHVVLLLPGGQGLEAIGSYDGSRARKLRVLQLTPNQIQKELQKKMENNSKSHGQGGVPDRIN